MSWLLTALRSSVGKKFVMAITGLLLCGFLVAHLAGNLLLYVGEKPYNDYAEALHKQAAFLAVAEAGLLGLFLAHLYLAVATARQSGAARTVGYAMKETKIKDRTFSSKAPPETWMFASGAIVLLFVLLHLADFRLGLRNPDAQGLTSNYERAIALLQDPITTVGYVIGCIVLGCHLGHGFSSAFQSLGLTHPRYRPAIHCTGVVFAWVIAAGFASFPLWAQSKKPPVPAKTSLPAAARQLEGPAEAETPEK